MGWGAAPRIPVPQAGAKLRLDFARARRCRGRSFPHLKGFPSVQTLWGTPARPGPIPCPGWNLRVERAGVRPLRRPLPPRSVGLPRVRLPRLRVRGVPPHSTGLAGRCGGSAPQDRPLPQMPMPGLGSCASDQPATGWGCPSPLLRVDNLPEWLTELRTALPATCLF